MSTNWQWVWVAVGLSGVWVIGLSLSEIAKAIHDLADAVRGMQ